GAFDVDFLVANQIRTGKINLVILHRFYNHSRSRLTTLRMLFRSIRAVVSCIDQTIAKLPQHFRFNRAILIYREESASDPALICDDDYFESSRFQTLQRFNHTGKNPHVLRIRTVIGIFHDRAVTIDKDGWRSHVTHLRRPLENWR